MASTTSSPMQHGVHFCVKNTFIDTCADEERPRRSHTEPLLRKCSGETDADGLSEVPSANSSVGSWSDDGSDAQVAEALAEEESVRLPIADAQARFQGSDLHVTVKNTFICLEEDFEGASPVARGCRTMPAKASALLKASQEQSDASFFNDSADSPCAKSTSSHGLASFTPTPWATEVPRDHLRFWTPVPAQAAQAATLAAPLQPVATGLPQSSSFGVPTAPPTARAVLPQMMQSPQWAPKKVTVIAQDKNLAMTQAGNACRVQWTVDAKKLRGSDKQVVSPPMEVCLQQGAAPAIFKMMLYPKGGSSFRKVDGVGHVHLKCCSDLQESSQPASMISLSVGLGTAVQGPRGPFEHEFASSSMFSMPREQADWDFGACVDSASFTFVVTVEFAPRE